MLIIGHRADAVSAIAILNLSLLQSITALLHSCSCASAAFVPCTRPFCSRELDAHST